MSLKAIASSKHTANNIILTNKEYCCKKNSQEELKCQIVGLCCVQGNEITAYVVFQGNDKKCLYCMFKVMTSKKNMPMI